jgi:hypothetical protein
MTQPDIPVTVDLQTLLPPVPEALMDWASDTQERLADNDQFSTVSLSSDRKSAEIYWFGEQTEELSRALDDAPLAYPISIVPTAHEPGTLRRAALEVLASGDFGGAAVSATWPEFDGSGIGVKVEQSNNRRSAAPTITEYHGLPVEVTTGDFVPAVGRQDDNLHIGGSRLLKTTGGACTLGFAVQAPNDPSQYAQGGMFASHCGNVGDQWVRPSSTPGQYYTMGSTAVEVNDRDGAILHGTYFQPAVYIGSYTSNSYVGITSVNNPVNGTEICYSGSFSGTTCGNIVSQPIYNYNLAGVGAITGLMTANPQGLPGAGNGDSGGPGIVPVQHTDGSLRISASVIISAIPRYNKDANCQGEAGSGPPNSENPADRQCSHIVIATKARDIVNNLGYTIRTMAP